MDPDAPGLSFQEILATGIKHAGMLAHLAAWEKECWDRTAAEAYARETPDELLDPSRQPTRAYAQLLEENIPRHDRLAEPSFDQLRSMEKRRRACAFSPLCFTRPEGLHREEPPAG